ncbi:MAG TPA: NADH-quinone oxidoreductase subunit C [Candidatus Luteococcus avicola]|nr:NADH-quinone oxidoreductase subunit C [Candidatus Luteococcus avicola]
MSENKAPENKAPENKADVKPVEGSGKTIDEKVPAAQDSAPTAGLEREDAQPSPYVIAHTKGMWGNTSGDTSGFGGIERAVEWPGVSARPYGGWFDLVADRMAALVPGFAAQRVVVDRDEITFFVDPAQLPELVKHLRDDAQLRFEQCASVSGVHYPSQAGAELHVVYHLLSYTHNRRIRLEVAVPDANPHIPSIVATYPMADWHEREAWDMFGIIFDGHPALTRVLMPDDWVGHPQRKDYPLGGIPVEYKGAQVPPPDQRRSY